MSFFNIIGNAAKQFSPIKPGDTYGLFGRVTHDLGTIAAMPKQIIQTRLADIRADGAELRNRLMGLPVTPPPSQRDPVNPSAAGFVAPGAHETSPARQKHPILFSLVDPVLASIENRRLSLQEQAQKSQARYDAAMSYRTSSGASAAGAAATAAPPQPGVTIYGWKDETQGASPLGPAWTD